MTATDGREEMTVVELELPVRPRPQAADGLERGPVGRRRGQDVVRAASGTPSSICHSLRERGLGRAGRTGQDDVLPARQRGDDRRVDVVGQIEAVGDSPRERSHAGNVELDLRNLRGAPTHQLLVDVSRDFPDGALVVPSRWTVLANRYRTLEPRVVPELCCVQALAVAALLYHSQDAAMTDEGLRGLMVGAAARPIVDEARVTRLN